MFVTGAAMLETTRVRKGIIPRDYALNKLPWWAIILILTALVLIFLINANNNYRETFQYLQTGVATTLRITVFAFPISTVIGLFVGLARLSKNVVLFTLSTLYIEVVRGIPLLVLILMIAFGLTPIVVELINNLGDWGLTWAGSGFLSGLFTGLSGFSIRAISS
jgi:His/Glu/Gln/Arg/opine family amino acid ABC transporter permease subunit